MSSLDAIPAWTGYLGTNQVAQVLHNDMTLGNASIDILGPNWSLYGRIEGQYTVVLQAGRDPFTGGGNVGASISQTGLVPADAQSLQFRANVFGGVSINIGGHNLSVVPLGTGANYTLYGANIPLSVAGQVALLTVMVPAGPNTAGYFDSFAFLSSPIPEPSAAGLFALGALLVGWRILRRQS